MMKASDLYREVEGLTPGRALLRNNRRQIFQFFGKLFSETEKRKATPDGPYNAGVLVWDFGSFLKTVKLSCELTQFRDT